MNNKMNHPLITVDGRTLMDRPLEPPNFVVDTLISQGLHILAGSPKVGKSWLALWLAVTVAKGEPVWNMTTRQGTTLYLCLEDSVLRIQNRLFEITEDAPSSVHFCTECTLIGQGLEEQVDAFVAAHPDTVLVIIDTLQMVRPVHDATYANDYRDLSVLKRQADKHGIAILLIHHLRKEKAEDVFHRISGTTAISGAVDSSFTLVEEKRGSGRARLTCVGRDIEYRELELRRGEEKDHAAASGAGADTASRNASYESGMGGTAEQPLYTGVPHRETDWLSEEDQRTAGAAPDPDADGRAAESGEASGEDERTGWEAEREAFFSAQHQTAQTESAGHSMDQSAVGTGGPGADWAGAVGGVVQLGHALERGQGPAPVKDATTTHYHADSKALRKERQKKIALGHKEDDHEEEPTWQQTM